MNTRTIRQLLQHLWKADRWLFVPFVLVLCAVALVLLFTAGSSYFAPFVYSLF
jgi:uncharacterized protein involved in exopolysaccharide biosynthesis